MSPGGASSVHGCGGKMGIAAEFSTKCEVLNISSIYYINSVLFYWVFAHNTERLQALKKSASPT